MSPVVSLSPPEALEKGELRGPMEGYPRYVDCLLLPLDQRLLDGLKARGDEVIQVYPKEGVRWTAREVLERGLNLAEGLRSLGVVAGDHVTLVCGRHPEQGPLMLATMALCAVWAPLDPTLEPGDLHRLLQVLEPRVVLAEPEVADLLFVAVHELAEEPVLVVLGEGGEWRQLSSAVYDEGRSMLRPFVDDPQHAVALIICSSGTSGLPKACATTHFALISALSAFSREDTVSGLKSTLMLTSPAFWVTGVWFTLLSMLDRTTLVYVYGCDEHQLLDAIEEHQPPAFFAPVSVLLSLAKAHEKAKRRRDLSSLRALLTGGSPVSREAEELIGDVLRAEVHNIYGMTELNACIGITKRLQPKPGSVGTLSAFLRCRVVDPDSGSVCGPNEEGELRFKGPTLFKCYLKNPQATAEIFDTTGWLRSGDLGQYDQDGFFYVTGRFKDLIRYRSYHVSPVEIEGVLERHQDVQLCAVVGVPHPVDLELPRAYVVLRPNAHATEEELCQFVQGRVARYQQLRGGVVFVGQLPMTSTGKISRAAVRKQFVLQQQAA